MNGVCPSPRTLAPCRLSLPRPALVAMAIPLDKTIKRELRIDDRFYTVRISPETIHIAPKGHRKGHEVSWRDLLSGEAELTMQLKQSLKRKA